MPENCISETETPKKKSTRKRKGYFYEEQEQAVVDYLSTDDKEEKARIFNAILKPAFARMIEAIIRRYKLYPPDEEFQETFDDTMSFLLTKLNCFNPNANYKAYSYCGTICKNYLIYKVNKFLKDQKRSQSYDVPQDNIKGRIIDNVKYSYNDNDPHRAFLDELTGSTVDNIQKILDCRKALNLNENEIKVGNALLNLMTNWDEVFTQMGSNKFNKSSVLLFLKEATMLNTKELRDAMRIYKTKYYQIKQSHIDN